ncbi:MAG TPA: APC family permease [Streptosporangiaceae bacterium]|nr:APC family permease [Streptosporangiaceae bacterium]
MADTTAAPTGGRALFVRQSSGLVREVSVRNALFYNTAAFIGITVAWAPVFYTLAFAPVGKKFGLTSYGWTAILVGICCVFLGLIFASLATVMPRSGGDYVFTSRLIPVAGPFLAWVESFTLVFASLAIIAFEIPIVLRNTQISGEIIGIGTGSGFFKRASGWFTSGGTITDWPGMIGALVVIALILLVVIQPTRRFHRIVTGLGAIGLLSWAVMWIAGLVFVHRASFEANLPKYTGMTAAALQKAAVTGGVVGHGFSWSTAVLPFLMSVVLFQYIGFQYSAYIAGEVRGNIKRGILIGVLGALFFAVVMNSLYVDSLGDRLGTQNLLGWGINFWSGLKTPLGQPIALPLASAISSPGLWPIWLFVSIAATLWPFLLCPVYISLISRISLAWSMDRQVPKWFGEVNERLRAPLNAILTAVGFCVVLAILQNFALLPKSIAPPDGKLNLVSTIWFSILMALFSWVLPGVNAVVSRFSRPDLVRNAPWRNALWAFGLIWLAFAAFTYWFAGIKPISDAVGAALKPGKGGVLSYFNNTGITLTIALYVIAVIIYIIVAIRNRASGVETSLLYKELPPD